MRRLAVVDIRVSASKLADSLCTATAWIFGDVIRDLIGRMGRRNNPVRYTLSNRCGRGWRDLALVTRQTGRRLFATFGDASSIVVPP